jgi:hypothetical protein
MPANAKAALLNLRCCWHSGTHPSAWWCPGRALRLLGAATEFIQNLPARTREPGKMQLYTSYLSCSGQPACAMLRGPQWARGALSSPGSPAINLAQKQVALRTPAAAIIEKRRPVPCRGGRPPACRPPGCLARAQSARLLTRPLGGGRSQGLLPRAHATMSSTLPFCAAAKFALTWGLHARWTGRKSGGRHEGAHAGPTACATLAHSSRSRADGRRLMRRQAQGVLAPRSPCQPLPRPTHQLTTSQKLST